MIFRATLRIQMRKHLLGVRGGWRRLELDFGGNRVDVEKAEFQQREAARSLGDHRSVAFMDEHAYFQAVAAGKKPQAVQVLPGTANFRRNQRSNRFTLVVQNLRQPAEFYLPVLEISLAQAEVRDDGHQQRMRGED